MSRYRTSSDRDTPARTEGDDVLTGVNNKLPAELLPAGMVSEAVNLRFRRGQAATREGLITPAHFRWSADTGTHVIRGSAIYSDPAGMEWLLIATPHKIMQLRAGTTPRTIAIPEELTAACVLVQAFNRVLLFRGADLVPWQWSGALTAAFEPVSQAPTGDASSPIPNGPDPTTQRGLAPLLMNNRLFIPYGRDTIAASDLLDYTRYDAALADFNVNDGSDDALTALYPFANNTLLVFKDQSVLAISGVYGDLDAARLDTVSREVGCIAGRSVAMVGGDVFWLSARGVFRLQQVVQERLQTAAVAVSDPIQGIIERIHWPAADGATAAVHGEYYSLAVPIDGSLVNNAILPFNTVTGAWEGLHTFPTGVQIDALQVGDYFGRKELYAVDHTSGLVHLLYYNLGGDRVSETPSEIATRLTTRGYRLGENGVKNFRRAQLTLETLNPTLTITAAADGVNETTALRTGLTRSRTAYTVFGRAPYVTTNENDDHGTRDRQDYTVIQPFQTRSGLVPGRSQALIERTPIRAHGRFLTLTIANTTGHAAVASVEVAGDETDRATRGQS